MSVSLKDVLATPFAVMDPFQEHITIARLTFAVRVSSAITFSILFYDYVLTLDLEIQRFWNRRFTLVTFGFYLNRYLALFGNVPAIFEFYWPHAQSMLNAADVPSNVCRYHTSDCGRVYGLYERNRKVLCLLLTMGAIACGVSGWAITQIWQAAYPQGRARTQGQNAVLGNCDLRMSQTQGHYLAIIWGTILLADTVVFALTLSRVLRVGKKWQGSLFTLMLRDGTIYFGVLLGCHIANILTYLVFDSTYRGISTTTTNVIATSLIARLMLNIRDPDLLEGCYRWPSASDSV
ncbi:hypothetical protein C8Q80DRAFT_920673 [Daedaleopsis nitida]|nr:hypothetical protein C8Q80DRAFT_920673 [Daedaleopsis nitida]